MLAISDKIVSDHTSAEHVANYAILEALAHFRETFVSVRPKCCTILVVIEVSQICFFSSSLLKYMVYALDYGFLCPFLKNADYYAFILRFLLYSILTLSF